MANSAVEVKCYFGLGSGLQNGKGVVFLGSKLIKKGKEKGFGNGSK